MKFNVNHNVKVKLTEYGLSILREQHEKLRATFPSMGCFVLPTADDEGYVSYQLHDLMSTFGPHISMGFKVPFETEIIIEEN